MKIYLLYQEFLKDFLIHNGMSNIQYILNTISKYFKRTSSSLFFPIRKVGLDVGKMIPLLLQKIEELSLYVIDLKKENENMQNRIVELEK